MQVRSIICSVKQKYFWNVVFNVSSVFFILFLMVRWNPLLIILLRVLQSNHEGFICFFYFVFNSQMEPPFNHSSSCLAEQSWGFHIYPFHFSDSCFITKGLLSSF